MKLISSKNFFSDSLV